MSVDLRRSGITDHDAADLHIHTTYDGRWTPEELIATAEQQKLRVIAVADHDTIVNVASIQALAVDHGIIAIPAVEVTTTFAGSVYHLLLYNVDIHDNELLHLLEDVRARQRESARQGLKTLRGQSIVLPSLETITTEQDLMPFHIVRALIQEQKAEKMDQAIAIAEAAGISFTIAADFEQVIAVAHRQGAKSVLAHPGRTELYLSSASMNTIEQMIPVGLDGLEIYHALHSANDIARYGAFATQHNMLISCGSDSHGPKARTKLTPWPVHFCRRLLEACGISVSTSRTRATSYSNPRSAPQQEE